MTREQQLRAFVLSLAAFATEDTSNNQVYSRGQPLTKASSVACLSLSQYLDDTESRRGVQKNLKTTRQSFQVNVFTNNICSWLRPRRGRGGGGLLRPLSNGRSFGNWIWNVRTLAGFVAQSGPACCRAMSFDAAPADRERNIQPRVCAEVSD